MRQTYSDYFSALKILHLAMAVGPTLFAVVAFFLVSTGSMGIQPGLTGIFNIIVPLLALMGIAGSILLFATRLKQIKNEPVFDQKMDGYRSVLVLRYAMLEGPSLFAVIAYILTGQVFYLAAFAVLTGFLLLQRPSKTTAINDLQLDYNEQAKLENDINSDYTTDFN